uniref:Uncharacterized protein n=1 Tax=Phaeomonas parva TaxID=124430 RepID=A0A7S1XLB6_9STRA|mmetsp:Transcript_14577/g.43820  ORF Transcript_14577/g.43820 Transcript_14577/m.43820 type:complete len:1088 (+) Transcript_14577:190-3453(+)
MSMIQPSQERKVDEKDIDGLVGEHIDAEARQGPPGLGPEARRLLAEQQTEIRRMRKEMAAQKERLRTYREKLSEYERGKDAFDVERRNLKAKMERLKNAETGQAAQLTDAQRKVAERDEQLRALRDALDESREAATHAELTCHGMRERYEAALAMRLDLEAQVAKRDQDVENRDGKIENLQRNLNDTKDSLEEARKKIGTLELSSDEQAKLRNSTEHELRAKIEQLSRSLEKSEKDLSGSRSNLLVREERLALLQTQLQEMKWQGQMVPFDEYTRLKQTSEEYMGMTLKLQDMEKDHDAQTRMLLDAQRDVARLREVLHREREAKDSLEHEAALNLEKSEIAESRAQARAAEARRAKREMVRSHAAMKHNHTREAAGLRNGLSALAQARMDAMEEARVEARKRQRQIERNKGLVRELGFAELKMDDYEAERQENANHIALLQGELALLRHQYLSLKKQTLALAEAGTGRLREADLGGGISVEDAILHKNVRREETSTTSILRGDLFLPPYATFSAADILESAICDWCYGRSADQIAKPKKRAAPLVPPIVALKKVPSAEQDIAFTTVVGYHDMNAKLGTRDGEGAEGFYNGTSDALGGGAALARPTQEWVVKAQDGDVEGKELLARLQMSAYMSFAQKQPLDKFMGLTAQKLAMVLTQFRQVEAEAAMRVGQTRRALQRVAATLAQTEEKLVVSRVAERAETNARHKLVLKLVSEQLRRATTRRPVSPQHSPTRGSPSRRRIFDDGAEPQPEAKEISIRLPQCLIDDHSAHGIVHLILGPEEDAHRLLLDGDDAVETHKDDLGMIVLRGNELTSAGALALARLVSASHTLRSLDLRDCRIGERGIKALEEALALNGSVRKVRRRAEPGRGGGCVLVGLREEEADAPGLTLAEQERRQFEQLARGLKPSFIVDLRNQEPKRRRYMDVRLEEGLDDITQAMDTLRLRPAPTVREREETKKKRRRARPKSAGVSGRRSRGVDRDEWDAGVFRSNLSVVPALARGDDGDGGARDDDDEEEDAVKFLSQGDAEEAKENADPAADSGAEGEKDLLNDPVNALLFSRIKEMRTMLEEELRSPKVSHNPNLNPKP